MIKSEQKKINDLEEYDFKKLFNLLRKEGDIYQDILEKKDRLINNINFVYPKLQETILIRAAKNQHKDIVEELLSHPHIKVDAKGKDNETALMKATKRKHDDIVEMLLPNYSLSEINSKFNKGKDKNTALYQAVKNNDNKIVGKFLGLWLRLDYTTKRHLSDTAAFYNNNWGMTNLIMEKWNKKDTVWRDKRKLARVFTDKVVNEEGRYKFKKYLDKYSYNHRQDWEPIFLKVVKRNHGLADFLLDLNSHFKNIDLGLNLKNEKDRKTETALNYLARNWEKKGVVNLVKKIVKAGGDITIEYKNRNVIEESIYYNDSNNNKDLIKTLIDLSINVQKISDQSYRARVMTSLGVLSIPLSKYLLEQKNDIIDLKNKEGMTALMKAVCKDKTEHVDFLLKNGANVNVTDNKWNTPLMRYVKKGRTHNTKKRTGHYLRTMTLLIKAGIENIGHRNKEWYTVLELVKERKKNCNDYATKKKEKLQAIIYLFDMVFKGKVAKSNRVLNVNPRSIKKMRSISASVAKKKKKREKEVYKKINDWIEKWNYKKVEKIAATMKFNNHRKNKEMIKKILKEEQDKILKFFLKNHSYIFSKQSLDFSIIKKVVELKLKDELFNSFETDYKYDTLRKILSNSIEIGNKKDVEYLIDVVIGERKHINKVVDMTILKSALLKDAKMFKFLFSKKWSYNINEKQENELVELSRKKDKNEIFKFFVSSMTSEEINDLLYSLIRKREDYKNIKIILENCSDFEITSPNNAIFNRNIIHEAANNAGRKKENTDKIMFVLLKYVKKKGKKKIDSQDVKGVTPLMLAAKHNDYNKIKMLLEAWANPNIPNNEKEIALHYAMKWEENKKVLSILRQYTGINRKFFPDLKYRLNKILK